MSGYQPRDLTEVEQVEIASALSYHFDDKPACESERKDQFDVLIAVITRMLRRRNGGL